MWGSRMRALVRVYSESRCRVYVGRRKAFFYSIPTVWGGGRLTNRQIRRELIERDLAKRSLEPTVTSREREGETEIVSEAAVSARHCAVSRHIRCRCLACMIMIDGHRQTDRYDTGTCFRPPPLML